MRKSVRHFGAVILLFLVFALGTASAQDRMKEVATIEGEPVYQVLPVGAIPAIDEPKYLTGAQAGEQMLPHEPVLGVVVGDQARAYPINMLTGPHREIINDTLGGSAIAATW